HEIKTGIGGRCIAVLHAAWDPHPTMRGHHPQAAWNATGDAARQREDELPLAVPMVGYLGPGLGNVDAHGNCRCEDFIDIEIEPRPAERLSHDWRFLAIG